jgi:hypothetical protein
VVCDRLNATGDRWHISVSPRKYVLLVCYVVIMLHCTDFGEVEVAKRATTSTALASLNSYVLASWS